MSSTQLRVFLLFSAGYFVSYVFRGVNLGFAPFITHDLGLSAADLGVLTSLYFPRRKFRGLGKRKADAVPLPSPFTPWQPAQCWP